MHESQTHPKWGLKNCTLGNQRAFFWFGYINGERRLSAMGLLYLLSQLLHPPSLLLNTWKSRDLGLVEHPSRTGWLFHSGKCSAWKITKNLIWYIRDLYVVNSIDVQVVSLCATVSPVYNEDTLTLAGKWGWLSWEGLHNLNPDMCDWVQ